MKEKEPECTLHTPYSVFDPTAIILYGGGGHGKSVIDVIRALRIFHIYGIIDDSLAPGMLILGIPVLGDSSLLPELYQKGIRLATNGIGGDQ